MSRTGNPEHVVAELWRQHMEAAFPSRRGDEVAGVDLVLLDADVAGCVSSWRDSGASLDDWRWSILASRLEDLDRVLPRLTAPAEIEYYQRLRELALVVLSPA